MLLRVNHYGGSAAFYELDDGEQPGVVKETYRIAAAGPGGRNKDTPSWIVISNCLLAAVYLITKNSYINIYVVCVYADLA